MVRLDVIYIDLTWLGEQQGSRRPVTPLLETDLGQAVPPPLNLVLELSNVFLSNTSTLRVETEIVVGCWAHRVTSSYPRRVWNGFGRVAHAYQRDQMASHVMILVYRFRTRTMDDRPGVRTPSWIRF